MARTHAFPEQPGMPGRVYQMIQNQMEIELSIREAEAAGINPAEREKLNQYLRQLGQDSGFYLCLPAED
ncbi:hypothetical protein COW36_07350 [bacterium (Candidatus Blackallbacteria) CG17_big_fil_post_rev_8_21_14_2_50_48_46]|uniref:Uncharacterized protein n=1 Tax=bacterium (Candidatus Blackallbacteria) CG17_big_fil_post_rev_8_21_14_2_50_48_46 TaxID=2014261 RepID=A0A2M7G749_9BACT|nr:MAG: hypothetical protein COW64_06860 [bacterium (Candidatus Blackallbacteria) CG18_big_fil_WC_8_21_14_2_50_49_26]PIW17876.1 MAG: hypothetical protein COW36_07350 [bacterium (Candidatus Blackallbacteria) CG17_big_fil_post_rev_8_21_14_2_50_48_46]PIW48552.1 MAG: hypothetical protein COW20_09305 [bacterium (Candidatus Blackallbacteria) CG13_big_fil_rev_8_21_14_2_50_49_14]